MMRMTRLTSLFAAVLLVSGCSATPADTARDPTPAVTDTGAPSASRALW